MISGYLIYFLWLTYMAVLFVSAASSFYLLRRLLQPQVAELFRGEQRPFGFSLLKLAAVLALSGMYLKVAARASKWRSPERKIERLGGLLSWDEQGPEVIADVLFIGSAPVRSEIDDAGLKRAAKALQRVEEPIRMSVFSANVTDSGVAHLAGLIQLRQLTLHAPQVSDAGVTSLKGLGGLV